MNVLHIETSLIIRAMTQNAVEDTDNTYFGAKNIDEAFKLLASDKFDLIITALEFYDYKGTEAIEHLLDNNVKDVPIMVLTSNESTSLREELYDLGIVDFRLKRDFSYEFIKSYLQSTELEDSINHVFSKTKVAIVDDSRLQNTIVRDIFKSNQFDTIDSFYSASEFLDSTMDYNLFVIDLILPDSSGDVLASKIRMNRPDSIIIMISSISNHKTISLTIASGADDFITKPFDPNIFFIRVKTHFKNRLLLNEIEEKNKVLEKMASTDGLTQVYNHRFILTRLEEEISRAERHGSDLSIILLDLDKFKNVNDTFGHETGDLVLHTTAQVINSAIRKSDILGRYGGEEFLVILPNTNSRNAYVAAEKIRAAVEATIYDNRLIKTTISGGIATYSDATHLTMIKDADENMYKAKDNGRNQIV